jgi:hypothetical protein
MTSASAGAAMPRPAGAERGFGAPASDGDRGSGGTKSPGLKWTCDFSAEYVRINAEYRT